MTTAPCADAPDPFDAFTLAAVLRKFVGLLGRSESSVSLGLHLLSAAVSNGGRAFALPGASALLDIVKHDVGLHVMWLGAKYDEPASVYFTAVATYTLTHSVAHCLFNACVPLRLHL